MSEREGTQSVGVSVGRVDGAAKVTGIARYVDDIPKMEGELVGLTVRSRVDRARLLGIRRAGDVDWSTITVVTAEDVPENVVQLIVDDQPILAADRINHRYEPIALVAAEDAVGERPAAPMTPPTPPPLPPPPAAGVRATASDAHTSRCKW